MGTTANLVLRYPTSLDDVRPYEDLQFLADDVDAALIKIGTKSVKSTAAGTGVTTVETKDATGDLAFTAVSGYTYTLAYNATAIGAAANGIIDVNIRDGGAASPTNASTPVAGTSQIMPGVTSAGRAAISITRSLACPADIAAGVRTMAVFYVRSASGAATTVQLENAGPNRQLSVTAARTLA